ncbi:MAG: hypothetical protein M3P84_07275 [Chloroflexota bacterium]|nr:hypothetical protein [Chloroflexota bacterium]
MGAAARDPRALVVGLDAVAAPMVEASRRAARVERRGGHPNALFVVAGIETPPSELCGRADLVTVRFPWGSLLAGVLGLDLQAQAGLASLVRPGGSLDALVSIEARDGLGDLRLALADGRLAASWSASGFDLQELRRARPSEIVDSGSSWARRLGAMSRDGRQVTRLCLSRLP